jgi:ParB/RepB/Spo0J family partition protein
MPKMETASLTQKISLSDIIDTGNIRELKKYGPDNQGVFPEEIIELAQSIRNNGQIQPVVVKIAGEKDGRKQYELIAGFRRRAAFQYLCSKGDDFNMINASIVTGDKLIIQLVENIQRSDLSAREREAGIFQLLESGLKQNEIAAQLSKSKSYVSIHVSAHKMRLAAEGAGIDTAEIETSTFGELLGVPEKDFMLVIKQLVSMGGTRAAARIIAQDFKNPGKPEPPPIPSPEKGNGPPPATSAPPTDTGDIDPLVGTDEPTPEPKTEPPPPDITKPETKKPEPERFEADHRIIDVNVILEVILKYIDTANGEKEEVAKDILALIHERLDNA